MATYVYTAKKSTAETVQGQIKAQSQDEAIDLINQLGLLPIKVEEQEISGPARKYRSKKIKGKELYVFSRQMANLLRSGVTLLRALTIIQEQTVNPYFKKIVLHIASEVESGHSFSQSLQLYPKVFSSLYVTMVKAGEESGKLEQMLFSIAEYQHAQDQIVSKVRMALAYPALMAAVGVLTVYFILSFVLPKMSGLFETLGEALPLPTVILLNISKVLNQWWYVVLPGIFMAVLFIERFRQSKAGVNFFSRLFLRLPLFGEIVLKSELARFCRTLLLLLRSGTSITKALQISIPILSNELIKKHLEVCRESLTSGGSFGEGIKASKALPDMMGYLIAVGEESGNLEEVLEDIAGSYEEETNEQIKVMTTLLEPAMILVVGGVVGFIVFAMLLPVFQIDVIVQ